jgi:hypothetical protein
MLDVTDTFYQYHLFRAFLSLAIQSLTKPLAVPDLPLAILKATR